MQTHVESVVLSAGGLPRTAQGQLHRHAPFVGRLIIATTFVVAGATYPWLRAQSGAGAEFALWIAVAAGFGAYMALNIGANDVANNIGPTVGAGVMPLGLALVMSAGFEFLGALIAGGSVTGTIRGGIVAPEALADTRTYVWAMMAALLAAALLLNLASSFGAPFSTTHSIVGGVMGGGIAAAGMAAVNWPVMGNIATSWLAGEPRRIHVLYGSDGPTLGFHTGDAGSTIIKAMETLPDGRLLILERDRLDEATIQPFLRVIDPAACPISAPCSPPAIRLDLPPPHDADFEGITSVGGNRVILASDDRIEGSATTVFALIELDLGY